MSNDIFFILRQVNSGNYRFFLELSDEELKKVSAFVLTMWVSGAKENHAIHTILTDECVNPYLFKLHKHPRLLLLLVVAANSDIDHTKYKFNKLVAGNSTKMIEYVAEQFGCSLEVAVSYLNVMNEQQKKQIKTLIEESS